MQRCGYYGNLIIERLYHIIWVCSVFCSAAGRQIHCSYWFTLSAVVSSKQLSSFRANKDRYWGLQLPPAALQINWIHLDNTVVRNLVMYYSYVPGFPLISVAAASPIDNPVEQFPWLP
jgi:hypothetical protein